MSEVKNEVEILPYKVLCEPLSRDSNRPAKSVFLTITGSTGIIPILLFAALFEVQTGDNKNIDLSIAGSK